MVASSWLRTSALRWRHEAARRNAWRAASSLGASHALSASLSRAMGTLSKHASSRLVGASCELEQRCELARAQLCFSRLSHAMRTFSERLVKCAAPAAAVAPLATP